MKLVDRMCIKPWSITAQNGDFEVKPREIYTTSAEPKDGEIMVFSRYWVKVPTECFTTEGVSLGFREE